MWETLHHNPNLAALLMGGLTFLAMVFVWLALTERDNVSARLRNIHDRRDALKAAYIQKDKRKRVRTAHLSLVRRVGAWLKLKEMKGLDEVKRKLVRAGLRGRDALLIFLFMQLVLPLILFVVLAFFLFVITPPAKLTGLQSVVVCMFFSILAGLLPNLYVKNKEQSRLDVLRRTLPDAFDLMVICAEAGLSLDATLDRVSREIMPSAPEIGEELALTGIELSFLPDRAQALRGFSERAPLPGVQALVSTLIQTEKYGTPLAQALRVLSGELREERMMRAEEKAARLPAILTVPMILFVLPPLFCVLIGPAAIRVVTMWHAAH